VRALNEAGHETTGLDTSFYRDEIHDLAGFTPQVQLTRDLREVSVDDLAGHDAVVHLAALSNDALGELNPALTESINERQTVRLAGLAREAGVGRFVYASSCSVYGIQDPGQSAHEDSPLAPLTAYARAKVAAEARLAELHADDFRVVVMRNATMHGPAPRLRLDLVVNNLVAYALLHGEVKVLSDGTPWRPLLSVADFARLVLAFCERDAAHRVYNVGFDGENYQVRDLGRLVSEATGAPLSINPAQTPDERSYRVDFSRLAAELPEVAPVMDVPRSIEALVAVYREGGLTRERFAAADFFRVRKLKELLAAGALDADLRWA
jgi:nucleoside-diphosphate-sugar epimerase